MLGVLVLVCSHTLVAQQNDSSRLAAPGAALRLVSNQFAFTEGPAVAKDGSVFFTDQPNNKIYQYHTNQKVSLFLSKSGRANGLYIDGAGNIIACADENNEVWRISPQKKKTVLYKAPRQQRLNGPNDLWIDAGGGIYITDPYYQRPYWKRKAPKLAKQNVYYLPAGKKKLLAVDTVLKQPNGIVGTPDGRHLFVSDIGAGKIYKYDIGAGAMLQNRVLFCESSCDGMTLDEEGNLYLAGNGITVFDTNGKQIAHLAIPAKWTSNICFAGADRKTLFITASEAVYTLQMQVKGVE